MNEPKAGDAVFVRDASGSVLSRLAVTGVEGGAEHDFPVVWVTDREQTWEKPFPWPAEDVWVEGE